MLKYTIVNPKKPIKSKKKWHKHFLIKNCLHLYSLIRQ